jgi:2-keto-4-pentenoate hydratase/2-oxohepta-3-ene-1,7-dioic acid hydratase in catechol pathway
MKYRKLARESAVVFTLLACALLALPGAAPEAREPDRWLEARSPHVVVISNAGEEHARAVSEQFERVRALLRRVLTNAHINPRDPVVVPAVSKRTQASGTAAVILGAEGAAHGRTADSDASLSGPHEGSGRTNPGSG